MGHSILGACLHSGSALLFGVECLVERGLPRIVLIGLPDAAARETRDRLPAAFAQHQLRFPKSKVLLNLVPAQLPKRGLPLDLALATAVLIASGQVQAPAWPLLAVAELDLEGQLRPAPRGILLAAREAQRVGATLCVAPEDVEEAQLLPGVSVLAPRHLGELREQLQNARPQPVQARPGTARALGSRPAACLEEVRGQEHARNAAILAAAGRHSLLLQGPPGTGKSLLARKVAALLPAPDPQQAIALACLESLHGPVPQLPQQAPFRAPHHSVSPQALFGGGRPIRPGELSRAHGGVLFLDELPEFARPALEGLRQPLEDREVRIERAQESACFPADSLLIAARNPCPCGFATHPERPCLCTPAALARYARRTSGPLLDRFDIFVEMGPVDPALFERPPTSPTDADAQAQLQLAQEVQAARQRQSGWSHARSASREQIQASGIRSSAQSLLTEAAAKLHWSGRAYLRSLRVARTLADCQGSTTMDDHHVLGAISYRPQQDPQEGSPLPAPSSATD